ncbi:MAG: S8 family serine peptidase, partial [Thermoplasmata archaeon]|nr:S8 family serine peptidase [Thermoplasmata archaeon]
MDWNETVKIAVGVDDRIKIWNSTDAPAVPPMEVVLPQDVTTVDFNPNGTWLAVGGQNDTVAIIEIASGNYSLGGLEHTGLIPTIISVSWSPNGMWLLSTSTLTAAYSVAKWQVFNYDAFFTQPGWKKSTTPIPPHEDDVLAAVFSPGGLYILTGGLNDKYIKIWLNSSFALFKVLSEHIEGSWDTIRYNTGDGLPDISGGMIYYIATQGLPIPYSETYTKRLVGVESNVIPANGQLVAFMGALDNGQGHGTLVTSTIVGTGNSLYHDETTDEYLDVPNIFGFAPNTKIIAIANIYMSNMFDGWYFAVEGYDGVIGTGDEALIASNSYGFSTIYPDGWNFYDRFVDWVSNVYSKGRTVFVFSAGNSGYGYGTVATPGASTGVITVGGSTDFGYRPQAGWEAGPNPSYGDIFTGSSRGPTAMGKPDPDVVANGRMSFGSTALNQVTYAPNYDGSRASELWMGTSLSAPTVAGILALVYEAYKGAEHGTVNETITGFVTVGGNFQSSLRHAPIKAGSYIIYKNGFALSPINYDLSLNNGTLILYVGLSSSDEITATYRFYDDYPDANTARSIIMSSADDINYDVLSQGSGFANAERATYIANNKDGTLISPNT